MHEPYQSRGKITSRIDIAATRNRQLREKLQEREAEISSLKLQVNIYRALVVLCAIGMIIGAII